MDIVGLGTEIVDCARIAALIHAHDERFLARVYTLDEVLWCRQQVRTTESFAALWAAKEATIRALALPQRPPGLWTQITIATRHGSPTVHFVGAMRERVEQRGVAKVLLTMASTRHYATATALAISQ